MKNNIIVTILVSLLTSISTLIFVKGNFNAVNSLEAATVVTRGIAGAGPIYTPLGTIIKTNGVSVTSSNGDYNIYTSGGSGSSTNNGGFGVVDSSQFSTNNNTLNIKDSAQLTNPIVYTTLTFGQGEPTISVNSASGLHISADAGTGGPQFQLFGGAFIGQEGNCYFDTGSGIMFFRWNGTTTSMKFPNNSSVPDYVGWNVGETPIDTMNVVLWLKLKIDGTDSYIPVYR